MAVAADALAPPAASPAEVRAGLIWTLVRTDFKARYHGTIGGFVWALLKPMSMFVVLMGVFSFLFANNPAYKLNLIVGLFLWDFFAEATKSGLTSLHARGYLLTKARVPSWILVVTSISNAVITLAVFWVVVVTANHFWIDGAVGLMVAALSALTARQVLARVRPAAWSWRPATA